MPWKLTGLMSDQEIEALGSYLRSGTYGAQMEAPKS